MWNPLKLPLAAFGIVVDVARALAGLPRMLAALEARIDRLDRLGEQPAAMLSELERVRGVVEAVTEQVALVLAEVRVLRDQIAESAAVQDQLERTEEELAEANRQIGRMLETAREAEVAEPPETPETPERAAGRMGRFTGAFRRSSPAA